MTSRTWTIETAQKTAADIGFRHFLVMKDGGTVLQAMKHPENSIDKLSGIYLQFRSTGDLYIGRTINLSARQQKHADLGHKTDYLAFIHAPTLRQEALERELIGRAEKMGLKLLNRSKSECQICRDPGAVYDDHFPAAFQDQFLAEGSRHGISPEERFQKVLASISPAAREGWETFAATPKAGLALALARRVVDLTIPSPWDAARIWWMVSLGTTNNKNARKLRLSITCGQHSLLSIFAFNRSPSALFAELSLAFNIAGANTREALEMRKNFAWAHWEGLDQEPITDDERDQFVPIFGKSYASPESKRRDSSRVITEAGLRPSVRVTCPIELMGLILDDPLVERAAIAAAIAGMRWRPVLHPEFHNGAAAFALEEGIEILKAECPPQLRGKENL